MHAGISHPATSRSPILVTGGTGTLGRHAVVRLRDAGRDVRVLSRTSRAGGDGIEYLTGDLATGEGLAAAVAGAETVMHLAGSAKGDEDKARNLVRAASAAGVRHLVYTSFLNAAPVLPGGWAGNGTTGYKYSTSAAGTFLVCGTGDATGANSNGGVTCP